MTMMLDCTTAQGGYYLGAGGVMRQLTTPDAGYTNALGQGRLTHTLVGGASAVQHYRKIRRQYVLQWSQMVPEDADLIVSLLDGLIGPGPYYFVDPAWRNVFPSHVSAAGKATSTAAGWYVSGGGSALYGTFVSPPPDAPLSGVIQVTGTGSSSNLYINATTTNILQSDAPPVIAGLPHTGSIYLQTQTGTVDFQMWMVFNDVNGAFISAQQLFAATATTQWTRFSGHSEPGSQPSNAVTWGLALVLKTAAAPDLYCAAAMGTYDEGDVNAVTQDGLLAPWVHGIGVPKMLIVGDQNASSSKVYWRRDTGLSLLESAV